VVLGPSLGEVGKGCLSWVLKLPMGHSATFVFNNDNYRNAPYYNTLRESGKV
jgi:hypothetical protein